jgi:hypothetical protein
VHLIAISGSIDYFALKIKYVSRYTEIGYLSLFVKTIEDLKSLYTGKSSSVEILSSKKKGKAKPCGVNIS